MADQSRSQSSAARKRSKAVARGTRAGLSLSVARVRSRMREGLYAKKYGGNTDLYVAAVVEYILDEVIAGAALITRSSKRKALTPQAIQLCVRRDADLSALFKGRNIAGGGVVPGIHAYLMPKRKAAAAGAKKVGDGGAGAEVEEK